MPPFNPLPNSTFGVSVSIVLPVYNREQYVSIALESILEQTFKKYEVIAVDDGSTDSSVEEIEKYREQLGERLVIIRQENKGPSHAKNTGIKAATGEYIAFLDSDDYWHKDKLEKQLALFGRYEDIAFTYTGYSLVDEKGVIFQDCLPDPMFSGNIYEKLWKYQNTISGGTMLIEKSKLLEAGLFDPELKGAENLDLRLRLSKLGSVYFVSDPLYFYRKHDQSLTSNQSGMQQYHEMLLEKHFGEKSCKDPLYKKVQAKLLYEDGMVQFSEQGYSSAFFLFLKSILYDPRCFKSYCQAGRCCLGKRVNKLLSSVKNIKSGN